MNKNSRGIRHYTKHGPEQDCVRERVERDSQLVCSVTVKFLIPTFFCLSTLLFISFCIDIVIAIYYIIYAGDIVFHYEMCHFCVAVCLHWACKQAVVTYIVLPN